MNKIKILNLEIEYLKKNAEVVNNEISRLKSKIHALENPAKFKVGDKVKIVFQEVTQFSQIPYYSALDVSMNYNQQELKTTYPYGVAYKDKNKKYKVYEIIPYDFNRQYKIISCDNNEIVTYTLSEDYLEKVK